MRLAIVLLCLSSCALFADALGIKREPERPPSCRDWCRDRDANCRSTEATQAALMRVRADYSGCRADFGACIEGCR